MCGLEILMAKTVELIIFLFLFSGVIFFAGGEIGLTSLNKWTVKKLIEEKGKVAQPLQIWLEKPSQILTTILVGGNLMVIASSALAANFALDLSLTMQWKEQIVLPIATITVSFLILLFGEIIPKVFTRYYPERVSLVVIKPLLWMDRILNPIIGILVGLTSVFIHLLGRRNLRETNLMTEKEIRKLIDMSQKEGILEEQEKEMIEGILEFTDTVVEEVMIPLQNIAGINIQKSPEETINSVIDMKYSRIPVFKDNKNNIVGILYTRDLLYTYKNKSLFVIQDVMRPVFYIEKTRKIAELMREFKRGHMHIAIVVDKERKVMGLVTIEDLIEEIVGEISDEYN